MVEIKAGDWVVVADRWRHQVYCTTKATAKCFWYADTDYNGNPKERRHDSQCVVFAGRREVAKKLCEQLTSSNALDGEDRRRSAERREKRDAEYIDAANFQMAE